MLFKNLRQFKIAREQIEAIYEEHFQNIVGAVCDIPWRGEDLGDDSSPSFGPSSPTAPP